MALTQLTKIDGGGISTTSDYRVGVITASKFVGPFDGSAGNFSGIITATGANFSGNVSIGGTLTYEDVTNIDSVGIITAQKDIHVGAGLSVVGISTLGKVNAGAWFANSGYSGIWHTGMSSQEYIIINGDGSGAKGDTFISAKSGGGVRIRPSGNSSFGELHVTNSLITANTDFVPASSNSYNLGRTANKWLQIHANGLNLHNTGIATMVGADISGNLDVDGHTNLDNVSIAGVTTVASDTSFIIGSNATSKYNIDFKQNSSTNRNSIDSFYMDFKIHDLQIRDESNNSLRAYFWPSEVALYSAGGKKFSTIGSGIKVHTVGDGHGIILDNTTYRNNITAESNRPGAVNSILEIDGKWNNTQVAFITLSTGDDTTNKDDGRIRFFTKPSGGTIAERARIETDGKLNLYNDLDVDGHTNLDNVSIAGVTTITGSGNALEIVGGLVRSRNTASARFVANNGSAEGYFGWSSGVLTVGQADATLSLEAIGSNHIQLKTNGNERLRILSDGAIRIPDGSNSTNRLLIGSGSGALYVYHDGNTKFENATGYLKLQCNNNLYIDGNEIFFRDEGGTNRWKIDSSGHLLPGAVGSYNIGSTGAEIGNVFLADSKKVFLGSDQDVSIYHDGTHGYLTNTTGNLFFTNSGSNYSYIDSNYFRIRNSSGNHMLEVNSAGANQGVRIFHTAGASGGGTFKTTSTGIEVTGEVAASQDYPNFRPTLDLNFAAEKKLDPRITFQRTGVASFVNEFGLIKIVGDNTPRFNHDPITRESKGLLIEVQRTNLLKYSVDFASIPGYDANYSAARSTLTSTTELAPDGTNTASKYVRTAGQGTGEVAIIIGNTLGLNNNTVYTSSIFVKNVGNYSTVEMVNTRASSVNDDSQFNLSTGTITTEGSNNSLTTITPYPNDWYRISVTATHNNLSGYFWVRIYNQTEGSGFMLWGGQVEAGSFPSSYIPTYNNASVQRGHEKVFIDGEDFSDFYNTTESTVVCEFDSSNWLTANNNAYERIWSINNGSESDVFEMFKQNTDNNIIRYRVRDGAANVLGASNISYGTNTTPKMAFALKLNDAAVAVDGTISGTSDTGIPMPTVDRLILGNDDNFSNNTLNGHIKRFMYYPVKLSDSQVVTITS